MTQTKRQTDNGWMAQDSVLETVVQKWSTSTFKVLTPL